MSWAWWGQHVAAVVATVVLVTPVAWSLGRWDRSSRRAVRGLVQVEVDWLRMEQDTHDRLMERGDIALRLAAAAVEKGRAVGIAAPPDGALEKPKPIRVPVVVAGSDLPARGAELPDLGETGTFVAPDLRQAGWRVPGGRYVWPVPPVTAVLVEPAVVRYVQGETVGAHRAADETRHPVTATAIQRASHWPPRDAAHRRHGGAHRRAVAARSAP